MICLGQGSAEKLRAKLEELGDDGTGLPQEEEEEQEEGP